MTEKSSFSRLVYSQGLKFIITFLSLIKVVMLGGAEINKKRRFHTLCEDKIGALLPKKHCKVRIHIKSNRRVDICYMKALVSARMNKM